MTKQEAVELFGTHQVALARALGKTKSAISQWPDELDDNKIHLVLGAAVRMGIKIPERFIRENRRSHAQG